MLVDVDEAAALPIFCCQQHCQGLHHSLHHEGKRPAVECVLCMSLAVVTCLFPMRVECIANLSILILALPFGHMFNEQDNIQHVKVCCI